MVRGGAERFGKTRNTRGSNGNCNQDQDSNPNATVDRTAPQQTNAPVAPATFSTADRYSGYSFVDKIPLAEVGQHDDDQLAAVLVALGHFDRRPGRGAAADAAHQAFELRQLAGRFRRVFILHQHHVVDDRRHSARRE